MSDNESKMTLEEKLVQKIKTDSLMALVGDEDAIHELVKRAITEALYQPRRTMKSYGGYDEIDSPIVEATREIAEGACKVIAERIIKEIMSDKTIREEINKAIGSMLPAVIRGYLDAGLTTHLESASTDAQLKLREALAAQNINL